MVVVSGSWMKNVATYPHPTLDSDIGVPNEKKMAKAVLICRPNSHHFQERTLTLDQPVKVGRSVARAKPTATNAIFDCKVLSRHHALLWYENGKFYLQDTKSSNGTFVNNNKLTPETENHELNSGDIVQFGVDVVENNRKVTHGCIIATIKLYLPDGKEAKASPSIKDYDRHGMVPLDDLYRLNQVIQEANQREQCLETKLTALQQIVDETRKSTEESWQVYVGEERLLSRVSALENQLQQVNKNWSEDKLREQLMKVKEDNEAYQIAAKEALEKLHEERLQAMALAMEQERAKIAAEQEAALAKEQFAQAQLELVEVIQKLGEQQKISGEQCNRLEQREHELETRLEEEMENVLSLQRKLQELNAMTIEDMQSSQDMSMNLSLIYDDVKSKEKMLEDEVSESNSNNSIGTNNHISLTVCPVTENKEFESELSASSDWEFNQNHDNQEDTKRIISKMLNDSENFDEADESGNNDEQNEKDTYDNNTTCNTDHIDSKTLKYHFLSAQNELKRKIESLELTANRNKSKIADLERTLDEEKINSQDKLIENEELRQELTRLQEKLRESCKENVGYIDTIKHLEHDLVTTQDKLKEVEFLKEKAEECASTVSSNIVTYDQIVNLEEELVLLKERFAQISAEKVKLQRDLLSVTEKYNLVCNSSYNKYFFYVAPLIFMVLYLLISAMIS